MIDVSVVIPTYNRVDRLKHTLEGLEKQDYPSDKFEVIVVVDGSNDGTDAYLHSLVTPFQLKIVSQKNQGAATARNEGIRLACGDIVLFVDDDIVPAPQLISEHKSWHDKNGENVVVIGPMLSPGDFKLSPWVDWEQYMLARQYESMNAHRWEPTPRQFYTGNASLARCHLEESGGFDPSFHRAEDVELAYRLKDKGLIFLFNSQAVAYHYAERSFTSWMNIPFAYGMNDVIFTRQKKQAWLLPRVQKEFLYERNFLIQSLVWLCLGRPSLTNATVNFIKNAILLGERIRFRKLVLASCSAIFNLRYYAGVTEQLGGREAFFAGIAHARIGGRNYA